MKMMPVRASVLVVCVLLSCHVLARPILQPEVKEYRALGGAFDAKSLPVFHQDQQQCKIAVGETRSRGSVSVWKGARLKTRGIYIAVADSECGRFLAKEFDLSVPERVQGYAIAAKDGRVAIVGRDPVGALYGAVTFRQMMADGGRVESAVVCDWPDILDRGGVSFGRGLWKWTKGLDAAGCAEEVKRCIDELVRHKINGMEDVFLKWSDSPSIDVCRDVFAYARARGIRTMFGTGTELWTNNNCPKGMTPSKWPCVTGVRSWGDKYYCWADDAEIEDSANRFIDYLMKFGLGDPVVRIHPVDSNSIEDPECWSRRCARCRARWKDDERWKASANLFNIWRRAFDRRLPKASFVSPVVPYAIACLSRCPAERRDAQWRMNVTDYWTKLDAALDDKRMAFESWIAPRAAFDEYRRMLPQRPVRYGDTYPTNPGLFLTCRRKIGTMYEPGGRIAYGITGTDANACWESCLLAAEYAWNVHAPGWEPYDGINYWHPVNDTTGPDAIMTNLLPRICRTFWGESLAPYMCKVMSSGVLPKYLKDPAGTVRRWNRTLRDPNYDPLQDDGRQGSKGKAQFTDTIDFRRRQFAAAKSCVRAFAAARPHANSLTHFKRRYFDSLADAAPLWCDQALELVVGSEIDAALEAADSARARHIATKAANYVQSPDVRSRLERRSSALSARSGDPAVPPKEGRTGKSPRSKGAWGTAEVWQGEKTIDSPIVLNRQNVHVMPGSRIVLNGKGCIKIGHGQFCAEGAEFVGEGVLTNAWRIYANGGRIEFVNCRFKGLATSNPGGQRWFHGGICLTSPNVRVAGCRFESTQSLTLVNAENADVVDNLFSCTDKGLYLLNSPESRVERNVFDGGNGADQGLELAGSPHVTVVHNRFAGLQVGVYARTQSSYAVLAGNVFENCARPLSAVDSKGTMIVDPGDIVCAGTYGGHLQGTDAVGTNIWWSFTKTLVRTDLSEKVQPRRDKPWEWTLK